MCATDSNSTLVAQTIDACPLVVCGELFLSEYVSADGVNAPASDRADTVTSCPEYKVTAVHLAG
ncbi:hypothetical protein ACQEUU_18500 [Nonomuraea sp. CA-218870]|uniref:hypothetical protein n=1 Tax=Nonomuraea sp. CA-218870 TaxID=3239998 RepID=UPI003D8E3A37